VLLLKLLGAGGVEAGNVGLPVLGCGRWRTRSESEPSCELASSVGELAALKRAVRAALKALGRLGSSWRDGGLYGAGHSVWSPRRLPGFRPASTVNQL
jgi:hypothetical protein